MGISIKLCYRPSAIKGKDGTLYYQIIIKRTTHTYASGYRIYPNEWDKQYGRLLTNSSSLIKIKNRTDWEMQQIYAIAKRHIDKGTPLDFGCIISEFEVFNRQQSFSGFLLSQAERLADMGRTRTSETYISALHSFIKFNYIGNTLSMADDINGFAFNSYYDVGLGFRTVGRMNCLYVFCN